MDPFELTEEKIKELLTHSNDFASAKDQFQYFFKKQPQPASVLIPLLRPFGSNSPWHILLTKRTNQVADHKGQVAYPGGRCEPTDKDRFSTALREAQEEIGITPDHVRILGALENIQTVTNYLVTPIVGIIPWPYNFKLQTSEVSRIFILPLAWLANTKNYKIRTKLVSFPDFRIQKELTVIYFKPYNKEILWGVSAEITLQLIFKLKINKNQQ